MTVYSVGFCGLLAALCYGLRPAQLDKANAGLLAAVFLSFAVRPPPPAPPAQACKCAHGPSCRGLQMGNCTYRYTCNTHEIRSDFMQGLVWAVSDQVCPENLLHTNWSAVSQTLPVLSLAFVYQNVVPVVCSRLEVSAGCSGSLIARIMLISSLSQRNMSWVADSASCAASVYRATLQRLGRL